MKKIFFSFIFTWLHTNVAHSAVSSAVQFQTLVKRPLGAVPKMAVIKDRLIVADNHSQQLQIFDLNNNEQIFHTPIDGLPSALETDDESWVGLCDRRGTRISIFKISDPQDVTVLSLLPVEDEKGPNDMEDVEPEEGPSTELTQINCGSLQFETHDGQPLLWVGSPGSQEMVVIDPLQQKIIKNFQVSAAFEFSKIGDLIFTINDRMDFSDLAIPFIFDSKSHKSLV